MSKSYYCSSLLTIFMEGSMDIWLLSTYKIVPVGKRNYANCKLVLNLLISFHVEPPLALSARMSFTLWLSLLLSIEYHQSKGSEGVSCLPSTFLSSKSTAAVPNADPLNCNLELMSYLKPHGRLIECWTKRRRCCSRISSLWLEEL